MTLNSLGLGKTALAGLCVLSMEIGTPHLMKKSLIRKSRLLSLVLRHDPRASGFQLDAHGWADVPTLLRAANARGHKLSQRELEEIVETNDKRRFDLDEKHNRIRANQGHSIAVDLELAPVEPPEYLYHGSATRNKDAILSQGLHSAKRQHVHLSVDQITAHKVGSRHGQPLIFTVASGKMHRQGHKFYQSKNGVWLTKQVPPEYLGVNL